MKAFVEILVATKADELDKESKEHLQTISSASKQMGRLIDDLLTFSRTARAELNKTKFALTDLVKSCIRDLQQECEERKVEWKIGELPDVLADPSLLRQVIANLLANALKYSRTRKVSIVEVGSNSKRKEHTVFVKDNGVGFDPRYSHKLFGVFQRLHRSSEFEGTGIGLAKCSQNHCPSRRPDLGRERTR